MQRKTALLLTLVMAASLYGCGSTETNTQESSNTDVVEASNKTELSENHIFQNSLIYNLKKS